MLTARLSALPQPLDARPAKRHPPLPLWARRHPLGVALGPLADVAPVSDAPPPTQVARLKDLSRAIDPLNDPCAQYRRQRDAGLDDAILRRVLAVCGLRIAHEHADLIGARDRRVWASLHTPYRLGCRRVPAQPLVDDPREQEQE